MTMPEKQGDDDGQIELAFPGAQVGDVTHQRVPGSADVNLRLPGHQHVVRDVGGLGLGVLKRGRSLFDEFPARLYG
ncbi:hypothetical protein M8J71_17655 [Pseudarthrobacter sp. R1]|uniref:hypothetical protein n=1 Tax=Pseudarthrobacter sp. R1 TaxID=2944934 RepID=UPI00210BCEE0|nr:hypothetical protein [Pseudarthrobacter sp. R1]MCQ6272294.1 hypothetical protein [Pseudarthrobacter sp. R1]